MHTKTVSAAHKFIPSSPYPRAKRTPFPNARNAAAYSEKVGATTTALPPYAA